ncbi:MAG TPA: TonB-dependent receptor [Steroidobacteraceae bacterium]
MGSGIFLAALATLLLASPGAFAADHQSHTYSIEAQDLATALAAFAFQSQREIFFAPDLTQGKRTHGCNGTYEDLSALDWILRDTGLTYTVTPSKAILLRDPAAKPIAYSQSTEPLRIAQADSRAAADAAGNSPDPATKGTAEFSSGGDANPVLQEIIVTAQKREQRLLDVPISISAFDRDTMDLHGVRDIDDVTRLTPGLVNIPTSSYGGETIAIRGINSNTGASTTGVYIDDTPVQTRDYLGVVNNAYPLVFDLDRVEVLRGPQGTLFGSGSEGGTVRFITPTPSLTSSSIYSRADVGYTDHGQPNGELGVAIETPIVDNVAAVRASVWSRHLGGYIDRVAHDTGDTLATDTNGQNDLAARVAVKIVPTESLTLTPSVYFQRAGRDDLDLYWPDAGRYKSWYGIGQPETDRMVLPALTAAYDFGAFTAKSITSYFDRHDDRIEDYAPLSIGALTGGAQAFVPGVDFHERSDTTTRQRNYSQELRLSSNEAASRFSWVGGLFLYYGKQDYDQAEVDNIGDLLPVLFPGYTTAIFYGRDQLPGNVSFLENLTYKTQQRAVFGEMSYKITGRFTAAVGLRVEHSSFSFRDHQDGPFAGPEAFTDSGGQKETPVTPRFNLSYSVGDGQVYATAAKGYRTGGVNEQVPVTCAADLAALGLTNVPATFHSDTVWSYEVGAKQRLADGHVEVSGSAYWINWSAIQTNIPLLDCGFGFNTNLGKAVSKGFDLQIQASPIRNLLLTAAVGYDDAKRTQTVFGEVAPGSTDPVVLAKKGDGLGVPAWQASISSEYSWAFTNVTKAYVFGTYQYTGNYQRTASDGVVGYNPYTYNGSKIETTDLRAGVRRKGWDVSAYVNNLFNERRYLYFYQAAAAGPDGARAETLTPLTLGVTATYRY